MGTPILTVDAFTDRPFRGNPAAVCLLSQPREPGWMQSVAAEMNLSETAFVLPTDDDYDLRWFTPKTEVDLCGHATLATSHVLWSEGRATRDETIRFHTRSGLLKAFLRDTFIELDFPSQPQHEASPPPELLEALDTAAAYVGRNQSDYLVEVESEEQLRRMTPDFRQLSKVDMRGLIVTARCDTPEYDFVSRFFAPGAGVDEDPVTGSAHCCLGPYWQKRLGKSELLAYQVSTRGGVVRVRVEKERVYLSGQAITVMRGELEMTDP